MSFNVRLLITPFYIIKLFLTIRPNDRTESYLVHCLVVHPHVILIFQADSCHGGA
jgi:hypothetical protein